MADQHPFMKLSTNVPALVLLHKGPWVDNGTDWRKSTGKEQSKVDDEGETRTWRSWLFRDLELVEPYGKLTAGHRFAWYANEPEFKALAALSPKKSEEFWMATREDPDRGRTAKRFSCWRQGEAEPGTETEPVPAAVSAPAAKPATPTYQQVKTQVKASLDDEDNAKYTEHLRGALVRIYRANQHDGCEPQQAASLAATVFIRASQDGKLGLVPSVSERESWEAAQQPVPF